MKAIETARAPLNKALYRLRITIYRVCIHITRSCCPYWNVSSIAVNSDVSGAVKARNLTLFQMILYVALIQTFRLIYMPLRTYGIKFWLVYFTRKRLHLYCKTYRIRQSYILRVQYVTYDVYALPRQISLVVFLCSVNIILALLNQRRVLCECSPIEQG